MTTSAIRLARWGWNQLLRKPAPRMVIAFYLLLRWRALVSPYSDIHYPFRLVLGRWARVGRCRIICTGEVILGGQARLEEGVILDALQGRISIGDRTVVNPYCVLYGAGGLEIGSDVGIAAHTVMIPANHGFQDFDVPMMKQPVAMRGIKIEDDVWIASNCVILDGVTVGSGAVVAAGAVVTHNVENCTVVAGVPARVIKKRMQTTS